MAFLAAVGLPGCAAGDAVDMSLQAPQCERPTIIADSFDIIFFPPGSAALSSRAREVLREQVRAWQTFNLRYAALTGHTDAAEARTDRSTLSIERARAVKRYLVSQGIPAERLAVEGVGATDPLVPGNEAEAHNRFVQPHPEYDARAEDRRAALQQRECLDWVREHCFTPSPAGHAGAEACGRALSGAVR